MPIAGGKSGGVRGTASNVLAAHHKRINKYERGLDVLWLETLSRGVN